MGEYIVKGAKAICKYGTSVGQLQVNDNTGVTMNGNRTATTNSLGNTFFPNFGTCSLHNNCPCTPAIVKWEKYYDGVSIMVHHILYLMIALELVLWAHLTVSVFSILDNIKS